MELLRNIVLHGGITFTDGKHLMRHEGMIACRPKKSIIVGSSFLNQCVFPWYVNIERFRKLDAFEEVVRDIAENSILFHIDVSAQNPKTFYETRYKTTIYHRHPKGKITADVWIRDSPFGKSDIFLTIKDHWKKSFRGEQQLLSLAVAKGKREKIGDSIRELVESVIQNRRKQVELLEAAVIFFSDQN